MRSHLPLFIAILAFAASGAAVAENSSSSSGGGASAGSSGGSHAGGGGAGGAGHSGGGGSHGTVGSAFGQRGGIGTQSLDRGSFAHAVGNHGAAPIAAKTAVVVRTAAAVNPHHRRYGERRGGPWMIEMFASCTLPRVNPDVDQSPCGRDAFKAPINPQTGQPIG